jgi:hypothetical protein
MMMKLLLWLCGADPDMLARCSRFPQGERERLAALGGTVLIPATLALCSWGYAAYTFVPIWWVALITGVIGAAIVMWLDRLLLLSFHKSQLDSALSFWAAAGIRLLLSCILSYGLSEPVTLLLFHGPIMQQMTDDARARELAAFEQADSVPAQAYVRLNQARTDATRDLTDELDQKTVRWDCVNSLVTLEMAGGVAAGTPVKDKNGGVCGYVSGKAGCEAQCRNDIAERDHLAADISHIRDMIQSRLATISTGTIGTAVSEGQRLQRQAAEERPPTDFAARRRALGEIEAKNSIIRGVHHFLIVALVLLDSIAFIIKLLVPPGEYEEQRDTALAAARATARAERNSLVDWAATHGKALHEERLAHEASKQQVASLTRLARELVEELTREFRQFHVQLRQLELVIAQIRNDEDRKGCLEVLAQLQQAFTESLAAAVKRFRTEIGVQ